MVKLIMSICALMMVLMPPAMASEISKQVAARVILGEAADQGLLGMTCVAEVLRRRGSTKGFYGYKYNRHLKHSASTQALAEKAWVLSANTNYTRGADHFENVNVFGKPFWAKYGVRTMAYKDHVFYRVIGRP